MLKKILLIFLLLTVTRSFPSEQKATDKPSASNGTESDSNSIDKVKDAIRKLLPLIESDLKWQFELDLQNPTTMSFIEEIGIELDKITIQRKIKEYKEQFTIYRNISEKLDSADLRRQIELMREFVDCKSESVLEDIQELIDSLPPGNEDAICRIGGSGSQNRFCNIKSAGEVKTEKHHLSNDSSAENEKFKRNWIQLRKEIGSSMRRKYQSLMQKYAKLAECNAISSSTMFLHPFEDKNIFAKISKSLSQLDPFYRDLHAFLRNSISNRYNVTSEKGLIREDILEHILGDDRILSDILCSNRMTSDHDDDNEEFENHSGREFVHIADNFFDSLNMRKQSGYFWDYYVQEKAPSVDCKPTAIAVPSRGYSGFRYCPKGSRENFIQTHYEMAKLQYVEYMKPLEAPFRIGLWPGFMEGVSKAIKLAASSETYLNQLNFTNSEGRNNETRICRLLTQAAKDLIQLRLLFVREKLRLDILDGRIEDDGYNCEYWRLMNEFAGVEPPTERSIYDFDASVYLMDFNINGIKKLFEVILGYQIYESLCRKAQGESSEAPLSKCNLAGSTQAGSNLIEMMKLGASQPWLDVLKIVTGQTNFDAAVAILKYYKPLNEFLQNENRSKNNTISWQYVNSCSKE